jgi:hypothetical protein
LAIRAAERALRDETKISVRHETEDERASGEVADHGRIE